MSNTTISISEAAYAWLAEMAQWSGKSISEELELAIKDQHDVRFWDTVNRGYAKMRATPQEWAEEVAERRAWESTLMDGLDPSERWTDDGQALPPAGQERAS